MLQIFYRNFFLQNASCFFMSTRKGRRYKRETKERGRIFQMKEENEKKLFEFYRQVLVLINTEMANTAM